MLPPPPRSTLFPYTTLFRSRRCARRHDESRGGRVLVHDRAIQDRKSTRLNSSHVSISYAVFCLKKKKSAPDCRFLNTMMDVPFHPLVSRWFAERFGAPPSP